MRSALLTLLAMILIAGCGSSHPENETVDLPNGGKMSQVRDDDPEMNAAIDRAQRELDTFIGRLANPKEGEGFLIKVAFHGPDGTIEHIWVADPVYDGKGQFSGVLTEAAVKVPDLKEGASVTADRKDVSDWLIAKNGKFEGGYTSDVLSKRGEGEPLAR